MGYTHYWTQTRDFTETEWKSVEKDIGHLFNFVKLNTIISLADGAGDRGTHPVITPDGIMFNGVDDDSHETMSIDRVREGDGWNSCKTARKPYDDVVTAILCYLGTVTKTHLVSSDGDADDFLHGLALAIKAWPEYEPKLRVPVDIEV